MVFDIRRIPLSRINLEDDTFRISAPFRPESLKRSIACFGLINLPILKKSPSFYTIISGFQRIEACHQLGWTEIQARILSMATDYKSCAGLAISENALNRELNPLELATAYHLLENAYGDLNRILDIAPDVGLPASKSFIQDMISIAQLPVDVQKGLATGAIAIPTALELKNLTAAEMGKITKIFTALNLSLNKQREVLTYFKEIAFREYEPLLSILSAAEVHRIITDPDRDRNEKSRRLRNYLKERRFPELTKAQKKRDTQIKQLPLGRNITFIPPTHFESETFTIQLRFKNRVELKRRVERLSNAAETSLLNEILDGCSNP